MKNLVSIFNTNELKYLFDTDKYPNEYSVEELLPILDDIMLEYQKIRGDNFFTNHLDEEDFKIKEKAKVIALTTYQEFILLGYKDYAEEINKQWKLKIKSYEDADLKIKSIFQKLSIRALKDLCPICGGKDKNCNECNGTGKKIVKLDWGAMCANVNYHLKLNPRDATVAEYAHYEKMIKSLTSKKNA